MEDWRIKDNKTICMNLINNYRFENRLEKYVYEEDINRMVSDIQNELNCSELDAVYELKRRLREKYKK